MLLLQTKLYAPSLPATPVYRSRLLNRLTNGLNGKLTMVCAPAGSGKTTLIRSWLVNLQQSDQRASVWLTLDTRDNDPIRFFAYLIAALQSIAPDLGQTALAGLEAQQIPNIPLFLTPLIHEITVVDTPFIVVLDDFHTITSSALHEAIAFLIDYMPPQMHIVLNSRTVPPIPIARLRTQGQITQIRTGDLHFTVPEATIFFNISMGLRLEASEIEMLEQRTEGWVAGLYLAAQALQGLDAAQISDFLVTFAGTQRDIADYLLEEVFLRQPEHIQRFLLQTCMLERFCAPLCDLLLAERKSDDSATHSPSRSSRDILHTLEAANLFLVPLDAKQQWYRYHHLFSDVLRRQRTGDTSELYRRAARWFEQEEMFDEAVKYLLAAQDLEWAARLMERHAERLFWERNDLFTLLHWFEQLPENIIRASPLLCLAHAWVLTEMHTNRNHLIASRLEDITSLLLANARPEIAHDTRQRMLAEKDILNARLISQQGNTAQARILCEQALNALPESHVLLRGIAIAMRAFVEDDIDTVSQLLTQSIALCQQAGNRHFAALFSANLIEVLLVQGQLHQAKKAFRRLLHFPNTHDGPQIGMMCVSIAQVYLENNELHMAETYLNEGIARCRPFAAWGGVVLTGLLRLARIRALQNNMAAAWTLLEEAEQFEEQGRMSQIPFPVPRLETVRTRLWLTQGNVTAALLWARDWQKILTSPEERSCSDEVEHITLARTCIAQIRRQSDQRELDEIQRLLSLLLESAQNAKRKGRVLEIVLLQTLVAQIRGQISHALVSLQQALVMAEPEGYIRIFVDEGEPMATLLHEAVKRGTATSYCATLLAAFPQEEHSATSYQDSFPILSHTQIDKLTRQEQKTLQLLATPLTISRIAAELVVEVSTVRTHIKRIYSKLDAHTRIEAVQKAKELGIMGKE